ncbi:hypothetical protein [Peribacillus frigoritolerans]|uniref:hypothetical protein n=1 Tax=Peribacillus frigoritolerans TaxID=450367 RepID=UPI00207AC20F|nr:hypothetical protein [Peribacillus frigoritolerans]USK62828.1 hypothetical protein LIT26_16305 [Peribacillus frigoritolerans]
MVKKTILAICTLFLLNIVVPTLEAKALTFGELPTTQTSKQWSVQVGEAEQGKGLAKPEKGKFHTYSLEVNNIGKDVLSAEIYMFRNEPNSTTKFALFGCPGEEDCNKHSFEEAISLAKQMNDGYPYKFSNFVLAEKATEFEVEIVWTQKGSEGRPLKETFTFTAE